MGFFDEIINIAGEVNSLKDEVTGTLSDTVQNLTDLQGEATGTLEEASQGIEDAKSTILENLQGK